MVLTTYYLILAFPNHTCTPHPAEPKASSGQASSPLRWGIRPLLSSITPFSMSTEPHSVMVLPAEEPPNLHLTSLLFSDVVNQTNCMYYITQIHFSSFVNKTHKSQLQRKCPTQPSSTTHPSADLTAKKGEAGGEGRHRALLMLGLPNTPDLASPFPPSQLHPLPARRCRGRPLSAR